MRKKFYSQYVRPEAKCYDKLTQEENELHDSLQPLSVSEQVKRFTVSGEIFSASRRKELMSLRGIDIDDPDEVRSPLDKEHITPADVIESQKELARKIKKSKTSKNEAVEQAVEQAVEKPEVSPQLNESTDATKPI